MCTCACMWTRACGCAFSQLVHLCVLTLREENIGLARTIYTRCIYGIFGKKTTKYTVIHGVYKQSWPTLEKQCVSSK